MEDKIQINLPDDEEKEWNESASRPLSMSMNGGIKDGGLSSRIPRFSRRGSTNDIQSSRLSSSFNSSFELPLNKSLDCNMLPIKEITVERQRGLKRYHSIYERGEHSERKEMCSSQKITTTSPTVVRPKSPVSPKKGLNPVAVKRHKSFSAGESRMPLKRRSLLSPRSFEPPRSSSPPSPSSLNRRRGTIHTLDVARKEGIIHAKSATKTAAVEDPGRVQVFVRIRPLNETEDVMKHPLAVSVPDEESTQLQIHDGKSEKCYQFDGVVNDSTSNKDVFKTVGEPLVYSALSGFNGILMCYGQTGTGKTYTLMSNDGMSVRIVYQCFKVINADKNHKYTVNCSYLQIYQEKLYDLLNETRTIDLSLREHPKTGVYIENLTEYVVHSPKEVLNLLKLGKRRLVFAETKMNRASSRSHAICQLKFLKERVYPDSSNTPCSPSPYGMKTPDFSDDDEYDDNTDQLAQSMDSSYQSLIDDDEDEDVLRNVTQLEDGVTSVHGKIYICDLAGSERIKKTKASGERLQEAQHINSSLLELGNVIQALAEGNRLHVPFRNSTLTRLLQEGLSGNCKTRLVVCIAPTVRDIHETKCSLNFGSRAMKVQVMAHVNYEVDYKKLAEALAAKLETLENEWNIKKKNYEKFIAQLKSEVGTRQFGTPTEFIAGKSTPRQIQSLLLVELMTLQLFHNVQVNSLKTPNIDDALQLPSTHRDMMLQSMEGLLELLSDYMRDSQNLRSKNLSNLSNSGNSSAVTSPDCIEQNSSAAMDVPSTLEPVARFLEHSQIISANSQASVGGKLDGPFGKRTEERLHRVVDSLLQLKETVSCRAIKHLKDTFENALRDCNKSISSLNSLDDIVAMLDEQKDLLSNFDSLDDVVALEQSLYYLQMDKAFLSCLILLNTQTKDCCGVWNNAKLASSHPNTDMKLLLEELTTERSARDKLQDELYTVKEEQVIAEEKLKDIELELKTVRELKDSLESKLHFVEDRSALYEEQLKNLKKEQEKFEERILEIEKQKMQLETSLKSSDNNNARKERLIVDLKNEKVALDSLVTTLKEEICILEKERSQDLEERRRIEEELEDVRDRNIILETEWSCCREENGLLENELIALEEDKAILEDELLKYRDDVKMLEEAVSMLEAQGCDYKQDIVSLKVKEERLLASIRTEKDKFNKELNSLRQEMSTLRVERRRFQRDISVSKADKSNTERAYNALKVQKDALQEDVSSYKQDEKRLQREISLLKSDRAKLERDVMNLKNENTKLKQELIHADKLKVDLKLLQKNEEKIAQIFNTEKNKLYDNLVVFKEKFTRMEQDFSKITLEKDKLAKQLRRFEQISQADLGNMRRSQSQPNANAASSKPTTPEKAKVKPALSVQGALVRRSVHSGEVSEVEGRVLDLQRRLAFFMAEKEDIQKELITTRERNAKLTSEIKFLEEDTSKIQSLLTTLSTEKEALLTKLTKASESKVVLEKEKDELKEAVEQAQNTSTTLQLQLEEVSEQNRLLEIDHVTVKESVKALQNETIVLVAENKHIKSEFGKVDDELQATRSTVQNLNKKLSEFKKKVKEANEKENNLQEQVSLLETENMSLTDQLGACHHEEQLLLQQLVSLNKKFHVLESTMFDSILQNDSNSAKEYEDQISALKEVNAELGSTVSDLKMQLETLALDAKNLKAEREEIEQLLKEMTKENGGSVTTDVSVLDNIRHLKKQVLKIKQEKTEVEEKFELLETQVKAVNHENDVLRYQVTDKSRRLQQEKLNYKQHIDDLQQQIEDLVKERIQLEAEVEYLKNQNAEIRKEIAIILVDNTNLERELETLETQFIQQEEELQSSTEETKALLRQLCATETQNLSFCTMQSIQQDDLEAVKKQVEELKKEKERYGEETLASEMQKKTLRDRLLMAELQISQLKSDHANVENQRRMLIEDLDAADRERSLLKTELHGLARALSPLKKEVTEVIRKQESMQNELEQDDGSSGTNIYNELVKIKEDMSSFNAEKAALELEQFDLEKKLKCLGEEKKDLRKTLRHLIQELDVQSRQSSDEPVTEMEESINLISDLIKKKEDLNLEKDIFTDDLLDAQYRNQILTTCVNTATEELRSTQEDLCLRTVERLKIKDKIRRIDRSVSEIQNGDFSRTVGLASLPCEVTKLKRDIENFETAQLDLLSEVRGLGEELDTAKNSLTTVVHFKNIIERNLHLCKERNTKLESHLRVIYDDLVNIESRMESKPSLSAKVLLETLDLHKHFQSLEDDLRNTESQNLTLKEDASDLRERCSVLEEEKQMNTVSSGYLQDSVDGQDSFITQLQREKDSLAYEKSRLETKMSLYKDDKKRLLEDFQRVTKSLSAYARYNKMLEKKLQSLKIDLSELENSTDIISTQRRASLMKSQTSHNYDLLCEGCSENANRKFKGVHENTQLLGEELLDCIDDNLSLEAAIFTFLEQKTELEQQVVALETEQRDFERVMLNERSNSFRWSGSDSFDFDLLKRVWTSGQLSTRSKSMTSFYGESFLDDDLTMAPTTRAHTALGISNIPLFHQPKSIFTSQSSAEELRCSDTPGR